MLITKTLAGDQARALAAALANGGIPLRHTAALDLVAASHGLRSRDVAGPIEGSARPAPLLLARAERLARHEPGRLAAILAATTAITHPSLAIAGAGTDAVTGEWRGTRFSIPREELAAPGRWIHGDGATALRKGLAGRYYHTRYSDSRRAPYPLREMNGLAAKVLKALRAGEYADGALEDRFGHGYGARDAIHDQGRGDLDGLVEAIGEAAEEAGAPFDDEAWGEAVEDALVEDLEDGDDSKPDDLLDSHDACEVLWLFGRPGMAWEDDAISSTKAWSEPGVLEVNDNLVRQLARIGWGVREFRQASGNATRRRGEGGATSRRRPERLVEWKAIQEAVENACTQYFSFCLYAIVPVADLLELDLGKPLTFSKASFATYNPMSGTFFDSARLEGVTVRPGDGTLVSPAGWYAPEDICGLYAPPYKARLRNEATTPEGAVAA